MASSSDGRVVSGLSLCRVSLSARESVALLPALLVPQSLSRECSRWPLDHCCHLSLLPPQAFSDLSCARSVVLTSGTLSPLSSFSSGEPQIPFPYPIPQSPYPIPWSCLKESSLPPELGMGFSVQLEANHVVSEAQVQRCRQSNMLPLYDCLCCAL